MECTLYKYKKEIATHYVGCTGREYPKNEYSNHGNDGIHRGFNDLPKSEYPFTIKYKTELTWQCCKLCSCEEKHL